METINNYINESIIPIGYKFNKSLLSMDDPVINNELDSKAKQDALYAKMQKHEYDKQLSRKILERCLNSIYNLVTGNSHKDFKHTDSIILYNSIQNKCNEILNESAININNDILMNQAKLYKTLYENQYMKDIARYKLENSGNIIAYNNEGIVRFNPKGIYDIVCSWCYNNMAHARYDDILINS